MRIFVSALALSLLAACGGPADTKPETRPPASTAPAAASPAAPTAAPGEPSPEFAALPPPYNAASYAAGARTWKLCQSCHLTAEGAGSANMPGPNLFGLFGRQVASLPDFAYSPALKAETFSWTPEQLDHWLANPRTFVPGNRMTFSGVRKESDRTAVIAYLMIQTGYLAPETAEAPAE